MGLDWPCLQRPCALCGEPMGKHVVPGPKDHEAGLVGAMGLVCPSNHIHEPAVADTEGKRT